jgi:hypothetical protein
MSLARSRERYGEVEHIERVRSPEFRQEQLAIVLGQLEWIWSWRRDQQMLLFDCGAGMGEFLAALEGDARFRCYGMDKDMRCVVEAREHAPSASVQWGDACRLDGTGIPTDTYDVVVATGLIEHVSSPDELLHGIHRITNRWALIMTPNALRPAKVWDALCGRIRWERSGHLQTWDYHLFVQQLQHHGFRVHHVDVRFVDFPWLHWWPWLVKKLSYGPLRRWFPMLGSEMFAVCEKVR